MRRSFAPLGCKSCAAVLISGTIFLHLHAMKIFTSQQLKALDQYTIQNEPVESYALMERAAQRMASVLLKRYGAAGRRYVVFAGPGNNGGDALAIARILAEYEAQIDAYIFNIGGRISENCAENEKRLAGMKSVTLTEITQQFDPAPLSADDIVVDGLFGTGLNKPLAGGFAGLVAYINSQKAHVVSIDVPSGMMGEDNSFNVLRGIVRAELTLTVQQPRLAFFFADMAAFTGEVVTLDIGLSKEYIEETPTPYTTQGASEVAPLLHRRSPFAHKGTFGHGLLVAGSYGMAGASLLAGRAALRSGIGKLTIHAPVCNKDILQVGLPEAVLSIDSGVKYFTRAENPLTYDAVAIGPGLGRFHDTDSAFVEQARGCVRPLVVDADGINILAEHKGWLSQLPQGAILTPHPGEFARLSDINSPGGGFAMLHAARDMAMQYQLYVVLKGHFTFINTPEGHTYINTSGNSGMATAGSGDVLTGVLLALLSQGYTPEDACRLGVWLHGAAGDIAAGRLGEDGVMASDIVEALPYAIKGLRG